MSDRAFVVDLSPYVETRFFGDRPHVRGRRIPIAVIAHMAADNGHGISELVYDFNLSEAEVLAALFYYSEHQEAIDAQEAAVRQEYVHFYKDNGAD